MGGFTAKVGLGDLRDLFPLKWFHESALSPCCDPIMFLSMGSEALRCQFELIFSFLFTFQSCHQLFINDYRDAGGN